MMVDTHHKQGAEVRMAEGIVYRRCLASETRLSNKTNSRKKKTGEVVLNELTMKPDDGFEKPTSPDINREKKPNEIPKKQTEEQEPKEN